MPRVRSASKIHVDNSPQEPLAPCLASAVGDLSLSPGPSAAQDAADSCADGQLFRAYGHDARIFDLCFHPASSELLISASDDCTAGVWRRQQGGSAAGGRYMQVASFRGHSDSVMRAAWSPDGRIVASGSSDGVVCLWHPTEPALTARHNLGAAGTQHVASLEGHPEEVYACIFLQQQPTSSISHGSSSSTAGQRLLTASGESLFLWDIPTQQLLQQAPPPLPPDSAGDGDPQVPERWRPGYLFGVAAQPDGPLLGAACSDGRLRLWAREAGDSSISPLCTLPWNQAMGSDCCFGSGGLFAAVSKDGCCIIMDVRNGSCLHHLQLDAPLLSCKLLQEGSSQVLVAAGADGAVHFVDVASGDVACVMAESAPLRPLLCASLSSDGAWLAASGEVVRLEEDSLLGSSAGRNQPPAKWSPIHIWQRSGTKQARS